MTLDRAILLPCIQLTHNTVVRRFQAFLASCVLLFVMWITFAVELLHQQ